MPARTHVRKETRHAQPRVLNQRPNEPYARKESPVRNRES
ncbi:Uncharacterised protein [Amycolatopsis camponoti]|uniref:Uncharacterized protein n=1 Tax=Amycolatopsis camponoti TaxID=2606593 RepID=A0A6I8LWG6_9PSEU|nr:Uncharacterised protein [Amycolatopsis camponoti]